LLHLSTCLYTSSRADTTTMKTPTKLSPDFPLFPHYQNSEKRGQQN